MNLQRYQYIITTNHLEYEVAAMGIDEIRNRLYRMSINSQWLAISAEFEVFGWRNNKWENFSKVKTYDAFFIQYRKV